MEFCWDNFKKEKYTDINWTSEQSWLTIISDLSEWEKSV